MAELRNGPGGGVMKHDLRAMLDGIGYLTRYGIEWRALPVDFPPWPAVYAFFDRWSRRGLPQRLVDRLRGRIRVACGRKETPTAASVQDRDGAHPLLAALAAKLRSDECVFARAETALDRGTVLNTPLRCG